jgi:hypothetical protein
MCSEKEAFDYRLKNFLKYGIYNCDKFKIKMVLLLQENATSRLEEEIKAYEKENLQFEVMRFKLDDPSHKKFTYLTEKVPERLQDSRWFIGMDDDTITDIDALIEHLDEDYDWQDKHYVSTAPMNNVQPMEYDLALLFGKENWYTPIGGPYHEWEICCLSQKTVKTILDHPQSSKILNMRKKMSKGWGDHCMGVAAKFAKIYPTGSNFISGTHMIAEHRIFGGWIIHCHHIYKLAGTNKMMPILRNRQNGQFGNRKVFLSELFEDRVEERGFYMLEKRGIMIGPPNNRPVGVWNFQEEQQQLDLHFFEKNEPTSFQIEKSDLSLKKENQNQYKIIAG